MAGLEILGSIKMITKKWDALRVFPIANFLQSLCRDVKIRTSIRVGKYHLRWRQHRAIHCLNTVDMVGTVDMVYTVVNVNMVYTVGTVGLVYTVGTVDMVYTVYMVYTVDMYTYIYCKGRLQ